MLEEWRQSYARWRSDPETLSMRLLLFGVTFGAAMFVLALAFRAPLVAAVLIGVLCAVVMTITVFLSSERQ